MVRQAPPAALCHRSKESAAGQRLQLDSFPRPDQLSIIQEQECMAYHIGYGSSNSFTIAVPYSSSPLFFFYNVTLPNM